MKLLQLHAAGFLPTRKIAYALKYIACLHCVCSVQVTISVYQVAAMLIRQLTHVLFTCELFEAH